jgi:hypothetical protein
MGSISELAQAFMPYIERVDSSQERGASFKSFDLPLNLKLGLKTLSTNDSPLVIIGKT